MYRVIQEDIAEGGPGLVVEVQFSSFFFHSFKFQVRISRGCERGDK